MHSSKLFSCVSFSTFCFSTTFSANFVFAENFKYEKEFLDSFISNTKKIKNLDENKLEKSKEVFLCNLVAFDKKFKSLKDYKKFCLLVSNLNAIVNGKLKVIICLESLLKIFKNNLAALKKFFILAKKDTNFFANEIVNKVDSFIYSEEGKYNENSIDLHNLLGGMYGKAQKIAFVDQLLEVCESIINNQMDKKKIISFIESNYGELKIISNILKVDKASLFAICKFYNRLKNIISLKEELKIDEFVKYLEEDEKKNLRNNEPMSYSAYLAGSSEKLLLYPTVDGGIIKFINENTIYPLDSDFFKILVNTFKKSLQLDKKEKDNHNKQFTEKKRKLFKVVFHKTERKSNIDNMENGCNKTLSKEGCNLFFRVIHPKNQEKKSLNNKENCNNENLVEAKIDPFRTSNSEYKKENSTNQLVDYNKNLTKEKHVSCGKVNLKHEIRKISDGLDFVQEYLDLLCPPEKLLQKNI